MRGLLDSNAYVALKKGDPRVEDLVRSCEQLYVSVVVLGELYFGFHDGSRFRQKVSELRRVSQPSVCLHRSVIVNDSGSIRSDCHPSQGRRDADSNQ